MSVFLDSLTTAAVIQEETTINHSLTANKQTQHS